MKYFLIAALAAFLVTACNDPDGTVTVQGEADLNVQDNFTECQVRQNVNSLIVKQSGLDEHIFIFDPSVVYPDEYINLTEASALRVTPLTVEEQAIVNGE